MDRPGIPDDRAGRARPADPASVWLEELGRRHLADLTFPEVARALRALSSCYVERRSRLSSGGALEGRGKRAAFALFYGPLHFLVTRSIVRELRAASPSRVQHILDLGCGTGAAGAAWALDAGARRVAGFDRNPWAVGEAAWTYRALGLSGRAVRADAARIPVAGARGDGILLAYLVNELPAPGRAALRAKLLSASERGACILVIEPIARRISPWWSEWREAFERAGGRADEWRFPAELPRLQRDLATAAGLDPRELIARTLWLNRSAGSAFEPIAVE